MTTGVKKTKTGEPFFRIGGDRRKGARRFIAFSTLTRMIFLANLFGLIILIIGALTLNQFSRGLIDAKIDNLSSQARLITNLLGDQASGLGSTAILDEEAALRIMRRIDVPEKARIRLYDKNSSLIADSELLDDSVEVGTLDPIITDETPVEPKEEWWVQLQNWTDSRVNDLPVFKRHREGKQRRLTRDIKTALLGDTVAGEQYEGDNLIVSVAIPVKRVQDVLGAVVFETSDVDTILASQRRGLTPIILIAIMAAILSSLALTLFIALPIRRLARAAEQVRRSSDKRDVIPDLSSRSDEIGDLSLVLRDMTAGLYNRIDDIANFAADVAHEIKNPLTSLRSATDTLRIAKTDEQRGKLVDIIQQDVERMDRLITDISKASRMDAALAKEPSEPLDVDKFLSDMADFYTQTRVETGVSVVHVKRKTSESGDGEKGTVIVRALETSFGQVLRNLIDNALTFSPKEGERSVRISTKRGAGDDQGFAIITVDDDGPGIPEDDLESIFTRFYTNRPKGAAFGNHSGLGLAISRQIMNAHHGTITAYNRRDENGTILGAQFRLRLPMHNVSRRTKKA
ncbi:MAG: HAMP domain-containing protein [Acidimicrobiales bacterium]|nr:HAMP domain-containing protein [Hyphomonadaceae bacterium]RZV45019.1 MAG: HAMP domain-containing protein [Acidimicrobiales bacterium]